MKEEIERKFSQIDALTGSADESWGKVKETMLGILNNIICKTKRASRKPRISEGMINRMEKKKRGNHKCKRI